jgi:CDGSH-type Zn-finger protein
MAYDKKTVIEVNKDGPYIARGIESFKNSRRDDINLKAVMSLCRCRASKNKPFCSGQHWNIKFIDDKN